MKYKIGDYIRVVQNPKEHPIISFASDMQEYCGNTYRISGYYQSQYVKESKGYYLDSERWVFVDEWLEPVEDISVSEDDLMGVFK